jgi:biopolymer transport protein ExbB
MLDRSLIAFSLMGAHWVLQLLIGLSIVSVGIMVERALFYFRHRADEAGLAAQLEEMLEDGNVAAARRHLDGVDALEARVLAEGLRGLAQGAAIEPMMEGELTRQRVRYERRLMFLGTLGNNAPFVGLFGTVLGIIKAFHDLSMNDPSRGSSAQVVMAGISEALVATAVGLAVALPAVVAFNYGKSVVKRRVANAEALSKIVLAHQARLTVRAEAA